MICDHACECEIYCRYEINLPHEDREVYRKRSVCAGTGWRVKTIPVEASDDKG